jgi:type IV pilus assembly protein PilE
MNTQRIKPRGISKKTDGFTLIEVMVVVAIVAILAAIALPSYISHVRQGRRSEGISSLLAVELAQEKWRLSNTTYTDTLSNLGVSSTSENGYYTIGITSGSATGTGYTATATAQNDQAKDTGCTTLTLTLSSGSTSKTPAACWKK